MDFVNARTDDPLLRVERRGSQLPSDIGTGSSRNGSNNLELFWAVLQRRKWWVLGSILLMTALVLLLTSQQQKQYTANASLLLREPTSTILNPSGVSDPTRQGATNASLVVLPAIAERAAGIARNNTTASEISGAVTVIPTSDSDVVKIEATSPDPKRAALIANAYGRAYIEFRGDLETQLIKTASKSISDRLAVLTPEQADSEVGQALRQQLNQLTIAESLAGSSAQLVERAVVPSVQSSPNVKRNLLLAILLGTIIGIGLAFLRDRVDQSLRATEELESIYGVPLLASISRARSRTPEDGAPSLSNSDIEAFRTLRANLRYFGVTRELRSILVSSPMVGDGKSTVASELATTMAEMGDSVVLVEADMHKPSLMSAGGSKPKPGLSSVLSGAVPLERALVRVSVNDPLGAQSKRHLALLPPGPRPPNPSELLESDRMLELLQQLEGQFERVIIDSPALMAVSDARALVGQVSGVLIVSAISQTRRSAAQAFAREVELLGGHSLGIVANLVTAPKYGGDEYYGSA